MAERERERLYIYRSVDIKKYINIDIYIERERENWFFTPSQPRRSHQGNRNFIFFKQKETHTHARTNTDRQTDR